MESPFILKASFYKPTKTNASKNSAHLSYIGTRPGVSLEEKENKISELLDENESSIHVQYASERPGSHGLFSQNEFEKVSLTDTQQELKNHDGIVWRMILSLKEEDANEIGFTNREKWEDMLRVSVPNAAREMGIKESNLRWVAAFHEEKGHPHVHLMLWEKEATRKKGALNKVEFKKLKNVFVKEIYQEERMNLSVQKTEERNFIRELSKDIAMDTVQLRKHLGEAYSYLDDELLINQSKIPPKMHQHDLKDFYNQLARLSGILPNKGRIAYSYMPETVKREAVKLADWLINRPQFKESLDSYKQAVEKLAKFHLKDPEKISQSVERAITDLKVRVSQVVLKGALEFKRKDYLILDKTAVNKAYLKFFKAQTTLPVQNEKQLVREFAKTLYSMDLKKEDVNKVISNWLKRSPVIQIPKEEVEKIINRVTKQIDDDKKWGNKPVVYQKAFDKLTQQLEVKAPYVFKSINGPSHSGSLLQTMWKAAFRELEKEQMKKEAEVNMKKKQKEQAKAKRKQRTDEREER